MQEFWANGSCDPFTEQSSSCKLGNYVSYAVDVAGVDDIVSTLHFATKQNLRLVIRNTGHEYVVSQGTPKAHVGTTHGLDLGN